MQTTASRLAACLLAASLVMTSCTGADQPAADDGAADASPSALPPADPSHGLSTDEVDPLSTAALGEPGCDPASPIARSTSTLAESRLTADGVEAWALLWAPPPWSAGTEVKVVWRVGGSGEFAVVAIGPGGQRLEPTWGPDVHSGSSWDRPGDEWGTAFRLDAPGCWELVVSRGDARARLYVEVERQ